MRNPKGVTGSRPGDGIDLGGASVSSCRYLQVGLAADRPALAHPADMLCEKRKVELKGYERPTEVWLTTFASLESFLRG